MRVPQIKGGRPGTNTHMYMGFVNWVSSTGSTVRVFSHRLVTRHVSPVSPSLNKEGNAACARQVCRKVTTRETRDQRRISAWYQNLRVLSAHVHVPCACRDPNVGTPGKREVRRQSQRTTTLLGTGTSSAQNCELYPSKPMTSSAPVQAKPIGGRDARGHFGTTGGSHESAGTI